MASHTSLKMPLRHFFNPSSFRHTNHQRLRRFTTSPRRLSLLGLERPNHPAPFVYRYRGPNPKHVPLPLYPAPRSERVACKEPLNHLTAVQLTTLDPTGARRRLFDKYNPEGVKPGDILLVRTRAAEPFAGVCIEIRRRGVDTAMLLRNHLTRVGVEMWFKVFSPNVAGVEIVQRKEKRARRARVTYYRKPKHDLGPLEKIVTQYLRQRAALRGGGGVKGRDANAHSKKGKPPKAATKARGKGPKGS